MLARAINYFCGMNLRPYSLRSKIILANTSLILMYIILIVSVMYKNNQYNQFLNYRNKVLELGFLSKNGVSIINNFLLNETINPRFYRFFLSPSLFEYKENLKQIEEVYQDLLNNKEYQNYQGVDPKEQYLLVKNMSVTFDSLVYCQAIRGFHDYGYVGKFRQAIHYIEKRSLLPQSDVLMMRRHEKDYLIRKQKKYINALNNLIDYTLDSLGTDHVAYPRLEVYQYYFNRVVQLDSSLETSNNSFRARLEDSDLLINQQINKDQKLVRKAKEYLHKSRQKQLLWFSGLFIFLSLLLNWLIAFQISQKLHKLNLSIKKFIKSGYKDIQLNIKASQNDEIGDIIFNYQLLKREITRLFQNFDTELNVRTLKIEHQKLALEEQNKMIFDSVNYATKIQKALLPSHELISSIFEKSFSIFIPRDELSGDFIWVRRIKTQSKDLSFAILGDCTGHGIPGAMISMIAITTLNDIVLNKKRYRPEKILEKLNIKFNELLQEDTNQEVMYEGVDIGVVRIDHKTNVLSYSGANRDLIMVRDAQLEPVKGAKTAVGRITEKSYHYEVHNIELQAGDLFCMTSDGYQDQFGGPQNKKFKRKYLYQLIQENSELPMPDLEKLLRNKFQDWKGSQKQVDDVSFLGIRI